jgi:hypothetical protein
MLTYSQFSPSTSVGQQFGTVGVAGSSFNLLWNRNIKQWCLIPTQCGWFCLYTGHKIYKDTVISRSFKPSIRHFEKKSNHGTSSSDRLSPLTDPRSCWEKEPCVNQAFAIHQPESNRESGAQAS